jgi:hypothetical protein
VAALCLASCEQEAAPTLPSDVEWRSEHFVYHARAGDLGVCSDLLERMERHFEVIRAATGVPWPEGRVIHYYKFRDASDYHAASDCPTDSSGCARDGGAYAYQPFHEHELIHTYFEPLGYPPRVLSEGVATLLSCGAFDFAAATAPADPNGAVPADWTQAEAEFFQPDRESPYLLGALLVSHLIETYGWESFLDLYRGPWDDRGLAELDQRLQEIDGVSFESAWAAASHATSLTRCVPAWACAAEPLMPGVAVAPTDSCTDSAFRSISPPGPGALEIEAGGDGAWLLECPADPGQPFSGSFGVLGENTFAELRQGKYAVITDGHATLTSTRLDDPPFGTDCNQLGAAQLEESGVTWFFQPQSSPYFLRLDLPQGTELSLVVEGTGPVQVCPSCEANGECASIEDFGRFVVSSGAVIHFPAGSAQSKLARLSLAL